MTSENDRNSLSKPKQIFQSELDERIKIGEELYNRKIDSSEGLKKLNLDYLYWEEINKELLKYSFSRTTNEHYAKYERLNSYEGVFDNFNKYVDTSTLDYGIKLAIKKIDKSIRYLNQLKGKLPYYPSIFEEGTSLEKQKAQINKSFIGHEHNDDTFIDVSRVEELISVKSDQFDLSKLIRLCEELNSNYVQHNYYSVALLGRAIIDHVPPIFGHEKFNQVAAQHGGKSIKIILNKLNESLRSIADHHIHQVIRKKEVHPNKAQIDFKVELDKLLAEIVQILG